MPRPDYWSDTALVSLSGTQTIDALLSGKRWEHSKITYSFPEADSTWSTSLTHGYGPDSSSEEPWHTDYEPLQDTDRSNFKDALQQFSNVANIRFSKVTETFTNVGDIRAAYTSSVVLGNAQAWSYEPAETSYAGDIWFNSNGSSATQFWTPGSYEFMTVIHELGHTIGLKHAFEASGSVTAVLPTILDTRSYTIMSYSASPGNSNTVFSFEPTSLMLLDIAAIQHVYGTNYDHHAGDDFYLYTDSSTYHHTIWDGGGQDSIQYDGQQNATIDLQQGHGSKIGLAVNIESTTEILSQVNNIWVAYGTSIEHAMGGQGHDTLIGNELNNYLNGNTGHDTLTGGTGHDSIDGGDGLDTAYYSGPYAQYNITQASDTFIIQSDTAIDGTDTVTNIERLQFTDTKLALDLDGNAGKTSKVLGAVFGAEALSDKALVSIGLKLLDDGTSYENLMQLALDEKLGTGFSTQDEINLLYLNLLGTAPTNDDLNHWIEVMNDENFTQAALAIMAANSDSNTQNINLIGLSQTGIEFL